MLQIRVTSGPCQQAYCITHARNWKPLKFLIVQSTYLMFKRKNSPLPLFRNCGRNVGHILNELFWTSHKSFYPFNQENTREKWYWNKSNKTFHIPYFHLRNRWTKDEQNWSTWLVFPVRWFSVFYVQAVKLETGLMETQQQSN